MKMIALTTLLLSVSSVFAQTSDPHPFQTQTLIQFVPNMQQQGIGLQGSLYKVSADAQDFSFTIPGEDPTEIKNTVQMVEHRRNPLPEITLMGGNYFFFKGDRFATLSADAQYLNYDPVPKTWEPEVMGGVFFTKKSSDEVVMVDSYGNLFSETHLYANHIKIAGGNFFIDQDGVLTTFKASGAVVNGMQTYQGMMIQKNGPNDPRFSEIAGVGANYFVYHVRSKNTRGPQKDTLKLVSINSENGFYQSPVVLKSKPKFYGGNYFIGEDYLLYTIDSQGGFHQNQRILYSPILVMGYSYFLHENGQFTVVDQKGNPHTSITRISTLAGTSVGTPLNRLGRFEVNKNVFYSPNACPKNHSPR